MKALFVRCYGKLTADMMIGGLIDMGVPPVYLRSKLEDAGLSAPFIEKANPKAQIAGNIIDLRRIGVTEENLISLYLFLACLDYLEVESLFVVPFSLKEGRSERARATLHILTDAGSTVGEPIDAEDIHPFAAAMLEGLAAKFMPMDGRFLADKTAYGSASAEKPTGESTVAEYLGYFQDRGDSIFSRHLKVFGMAGDLI